MIPMAPSALETDRKIKTLLLRSARAKVWISTLCGLMFMGAAPYFAGLGQSAGAPLTRELTVLLFAIGAGCIILAISARREISLLQAELRESGFLVWARSIAPAGLRTEAFNTGSAAIENPLRAA
jgi:hypothetical protein